MISHQLIFTSCRRGISGVNDGQQVYSYNIDFPVEKLGLVQPLFSYRTPNLSSGVLMTEDLVPTFPQSFSYKKVGEGLCDISLNTYLGKDYMGPTGRYGNFLSHHFFMNAMPHYPVEYFGSEDFRASMSFEEVNQNQAPNYLSAIQPSCGSTISIEDISEFLQTANRIEVFKMMAACLLQSSQTGKRIIINDSRANVIKWIASLHYLLPLRCAENVSFSTYLYNPMEGDWQIVGAVEEGTLYQSSSQAYVFDFINGQTYDIATDAEFSDFIEIGFTISTDALGDFHAYLDREFPQYISADEGMYGALAVYQMDTGLFDMLSLDQALDFLNKNGTYNQRVSFINEVFKRDETVILLEEPGMKDLIIGYFNSLAITAEELLELTLNAEGYLLGLNDSYRAASIFWQNFNNEMLSKYSNDSIAIYRELHSRGRSIQGAELFSLFLKDAEKGSPYEQFKEIISLLESPSEYPPYIDAYFQYAEDQKERAILLRFTMGNNIAFHGAAVLVREAITPYAYGKLSEKEERYIKGIWDWVYKCGVDINQCGKLWGLITGIYLNKAGKNTEIYQVAEWVEKTSKNLGIHGLPNEVEYLEWTIPKIIAYSENAVSLSNSMNKLGFHISDDFLDIVTQYPIKHYRESTWLKVAGYLYSINDQRVVDIFASASSKLSNRELAELDEKIRIICRENPSFIEFWESLNEAIQNTGMRKLKGKFIKKDDGEHQERGL